MSRKHFRRGGRGVFICYVCRRSTREVDQGNSQLCQECWDLAGLDNTVNDGAATLEEAIPERDRLLARIINRGGNAEAVKQENSYLWPKVETH